MGQALYRRIRQVQGVSEMIPYARAFSAKTLDFDAEGNETTIDYVRIMDIVKKFSFTGYLALNMRGPG